ncbi:hypothetical protein F5B22DRAFT_649036 [Xylaria bambusicola]|uniref:uncharacterized protein n=1 Tax=Xylaria bambusicola TaxID=326684 RepID=UPI00200784BA|nr:uncharacterized protein F5B22DRAFT_649036 [Xylaria bambusicola]KAI0509408.1 hypothetical protein F5B22DRAFT_649036 [Xylaria bambusicola]
MAAGPVPTLMPVAKLETVVFSKILDRDAEQMSNLMSAIQTVGFFYLDLSDKYSEGMLRNLEKCSSVMKDWFSEPDTTKSQYKTISMASHGYKPIGSQAGTHGGRDGWEVLKTGSLEISARWGLIPPVEKHYETFSTFQRQCDYVSRMILDRVSNALGLGAENSLNRTHRGDCPSKSAVAYLHYIPLDPTGENVGHNMHTDYGTLTLVFASQWGLQVLYPTGPCSEDREWQWVEPRANCAIVNVADVLHFLTGRRLISAVHRVLPLADEHRYSVTYFLRPSDDTLMKDTEGKDVNVMDWYTKKNNNYEAPAHMQDKSFLVGGLYKDGFGIAEEKAMNAG